MAGAQQIIFSNVLLLHQHRLRLILGLKGTVHPKMKILSSFTYPQVVPNLYECLCSEEILKKVCNQAALGHH